MSVSQRMSGARTETRTAVTSVERAFRIISLIADSPSGLSQAEVARQLQVSQGTADRLLTTLLAIGLVWHNDRTETLHLTCRISNLGMKQLERARPAGFMPPR